MRRASSRIWIWLWYCGRCGPRRNLIWLCKLNLAPRVTQLITFNIWHFGTTLPMLIESLLKKHGLTGFYEASPRLSVLKTNLKVQVSSVSWCLKNLTFVHCHRRTYFNRNLSWNTETLMQETKINVSVSAIQKYGNPCWYSLVVNYKVHNCRESTFILMVSSFCRRE